MGTHHHQHGPHGGGNHRRLGWVMALAALYMLAEVVGGLVTGSLALLADAAHMLADVGALGLAVFAAWLARRPATARRTYGYQRTEILAALVNGATLVAISIYIFVEAFHRLRRPPEVEAPLMMAVAAGGLAVNLIGLWILRGGRGENLNVRGAWLHVLTDALGSLQAIAAGGLIWAFGWHLADPIASLAIGVLVVYSSWALLKETVSVLMESAPRHIDVEEVRREIRDTRDVLDVHDLHVWTITSGMECLSAHVVVDDHRPRGAILEELRAALHQRFGLHHVTLQLEPEEFPPCTTCEPGPPGEPARHGSEAPGHSLIL